MLDDRIKAKVIGKYDELQKQGDALLSRQKLKECYALFRDRFGPDRLKELDGEVLLNTMYAQGDKDSLN